MASYATNVKRDIVRWQTAGLIDPATAEALSQDIELTARSALSFGSILATLAAIMVGAAVLLFIAAGWEGIPRLVRVAMLFSLIAGGYVGGAALKVNGHPAFAEAAWLVASAAFGGSIALIGQMYHLSGDAADAVLVWFTGVIIAAAALRSNSLTIAGAIMAAGWLVMQFDIWGYDQIPNAFLPMAAIVWAVSYWTASRPARHLMLLSLMLYAVLAAIEGDLLWPAAMLVAVSAAVLAASIFAPRAAEWFFRLDGGQAVHAMIGFVLGMVMIELDRYDDVPSFLLAAVLTLAGIVAAILLAGRESRGLRWIAYAGFTVEVFMIYTILLGSMMGTAGLFLASGLVLAIAAFLIIRIEKRIAAPTSAAGVAA